jgi:hypothetical protein
MRAGNNSGIVHLFPPMADASDSPKPGSGWQDYEKAARDIYEAILRREGSSAEVQHNVSIQGRSGVDHQIDVYWRHRQAGLEHSVIIDCKDFSRPISLEKVRNWFGVKSDIPNAHAVLVTREGYQSGAAQFASFYGISLKLLRHPNEEDWQGRIRDVHFRVDLNFIDPTSVMIKPSIDVTAFNRADPADIDRARRIAELIQGGKLDNRTISEARFENSLGEVLNNDKIWLDIQKQLKVPELEPGGPYSKQALVEDCYIILNEGKPDTERVKISHFDVTFHLKASEPGTWSIYGDEVVDMILMDFESGEHEYVKRHL